MTNLSGYKQGTALAVPCSESSVTYYEPPAGKEQRRVDDLTADNWKTVFDCFDNLRTLLKKYM